jgi:hypothetical protein
MLTAHVIGDYTHVTDLVYSEYVPSIRVSYGLDLTDDENILTTVVNLHGQPLKIFSTKYDEFLDGSGTPYSTVDRDDALREFAGQNSSKDVNIQDQTTPAVISRANLTHAETTVAIETVIDTYTVTVASATGISIGDYLVLFNPTERRFSQFFVVGVTGPLITLDSPLDFAYPVGSFVSAGTTNLNVDGSTTPVVFGVRGTTVPPESVPIEFDVTRLIFTCKTTNPVSLIEFGDLPKLLRGLQIRKRDGVYQNIFNFKSNGELAGVCYDWTPYEATNPNQGQNGFVARITFGGQSKMGVVVRLGAGEDLENIVQDDLRLLESLGVILEGHITDPPIP